MRKSEEIILNLQINGIESEELKIYCLKDLDIKLANLLKKYKLNDFEILYKIKKRILSTLPQEFKSENIYELQKNKIETKMKKLKKNINHNEYKLFNNKKGDFSKTPKKKINKQSSLNRSKSTISNSFLFNKNQKPAKKILQNSKNNIKPNPIFLYSQKNLTRKVVEIKQKNLLTDKNKKSKVSLKKNLKNTSKCKEIQGLNFNVDNGMNYGLVQNELKEDLKTTPGINIKVSSNNVSLCNSKTRLLSFDHEDKNRKIMTFSDFKKDISLEKLNSLKNKLQTKSELKTFNLNTSEKNDLRFIIDKFENKKSEEITDNLLRENILVCSKKNQFKKFSQSSLKEIFHNLDKNESGFIHSGNLNLRDFSAVNLEVFSELIIEIYKNPLKLYDFKDFYDLCQTHL